MAKPIVFERGRIYDVPYELLLYVLSWPLENAEKLKELLSELNAPFQIERKENNWIVRLKGGAPANFLKPEANIDNLSYRPELADSDHFILKWFVEVRSRLLHSSEKGIVEWHVIPSREENKTFVFAKATFRSSNLKYVMHSIFRTTGEKLLTYGADLMGHALRKSLRKPFKI